MTSKELETRLKDIICHKKTFLDLSDLGLTSIPAEILELNWLEGVSLNNNSISDLSFIPLFRNLRYLDIRNNRVTTLDPAILNYGLQLKWDDDNDRSGIYFKGNPLHNPPPEMLMHGNEAVKAYLNSLPKISKDVLPFGECKVMVLGDPQAGKTSLIDSVAGIEFNDFQKPTKGLEIRTLAVRFQADFIKINFWDFGGQEIYNSLHQLFLVNASLYIIVVDPRRQDTVYFWLETIKTFVGDVPVLIVYSKFDLHSNTTFYFDELKSKFQNITGFCTVSSKENKGIDELLNAIIKVIENGKKSGFALPESWTLIKNKIGSLEQDTILYAEFAELCAKSNIKSPVEQNQIAGLFNQYGVFIHFTNISLFSRIILKPVWIANLISELLTSGLANKNNGILDFEKIGFIINDRDRNLSTPEIRFIIGVMVESEILLEVKDGSYIVPALLPAKSLTLPDFSHDSLLFNFDFHFLPTNIFVKTAINLINKFGYEAISRTALIVSAKNAKALITEDRHYKRITISCTGKGQKELLFLIQDIVRKTCQSYHTIQFNESFFVGKDRQQIDLGKLLSFQNDNIETEYITGISKVVDIKHALNDIEPTNKIELIPVKIFISYAPEDDIFRRALYRHLYSLVRSNQAILWEEVIQPGLEFDKLLKSRFTESDLIISLISSDYIASDICYVNEFSEAVRAHHKNEKFVVTILIRNCLWEDALPQPQIKPIPEPPISLQPDADTAWREVIMVVRDKLNLIRKLKYNQSSV